MDRVGLAARYLDTVGLGRDTEFDLDRAPDSGSGSADWDRHSDYSDRHWLVGPAEDIDFEGRGDSPGWRPVDWDRQDCWNRDLVVALGSGTGYLEKEHSRRIAVVGFDRDHTVVESSLGKMGIPGKGNSLVQFGYLDWGTPFVELRLFVRKDWR